MKFKKRNVRFFVSDIKYREWIRIPITISIRFISSNYDAYYYISNGKDYFVFGCEHHELNKWTDKFIKKLCLKHRTNQYAQIHTALKFIKEQLENSNKLYGGH